MGISAKKSEDLVKFSVAYYLLKMNLIFEIRLISFIWNFQEIYFNRQPNDKNNFNKLSK